MINDSEAAFASFTIQMFVPKKDIDLVRKSVNQLNIMLLDMKETKDFFIVELYVKTSYSIYALGKSVAYMELLK